MRQTRWFCNGCEREWVFALLWAEGDPCPICASTQIEQRKYLAAFPGGDIPREKVVKQSASIIPFSRGVMINDTPIVLEGLS